MKLLEVPISDISRNPWNPHYAFSEERDRILQSILDKGMRDPIIVAEWDRPVEWNGKTYSPTTPYLLIDGEQRYSAYSLGVERGVLPSDIPALITGKLSEQSDVWWADLGERLNHARGTGEDLEKTAHIVQAMMQAKRANLQDIARSIGKPKDMLEQALQLAQNRVKLVPLRPEKNTDREDVFSVLKFENEDAYAEFEELVGKVIKRLEEEGYELPSIRRYRRSEAVRVALQRFL